MYKKLSAVIAALIILFCICSDSFAASGRKKAKSITINDENWYLSNDELYGISISYPDRNDVGLYSVIIKVMDMKTKKIIKTEEMAFQEITDAVDDLKLQYGSDSVQIGYPTEGCIEDFCKEGKNYYRFVIDVVIFTEGLGVMEYLQGIGLSPR